MRTAVIFLITLTLCATPEAFAKPNVSATGGTCFGKCMDRCGANTTVEKKKCQTDCDTICKIEGVTPLAPGKQADPGSGNTPATSGPKKLKTQ